LDFDKKAARFCAAFLYEIDQKHFFMLRDGTAVATSGFVFRGTKNLARPFRKKIESLNPHPGIYCENPLLPEGGASWHETYA
jgi:hypothetical protein